MKTQIDLSTRPEAWPGLLLAMSCVVLESLTSPTRAAVTEAWVQRYSNEVSDSTDRAVKIVRDAANDIIVTGSTDDGVHGQDMLTIKYSGVDGSVLWQKRYNGPANSDDFAAALAVDSCGNAVVTGSSIGIDSFGNENRDYYTAKYAAADGTLLWEKRYDGGAEGGGNDNAIAVAVDVSGNVLVTGSSYGVWTLDIYTAKHAAADGALLWEQRFAPEVLVGPSVAVPAAMALDSHGNVVVTGGTGYKQPSLAYTAKYGATDGALLWEKRGPGNGYGHATAVAVDASGNVVVTGFVHNGDPNDGSAFHTAKYAATDGTLLWEKRSSGPAHYINHQLQAVAMDRNGNVVVVWNSQDSGSQFDSYTAKFAAADGLLLWEKRFNGPMNNDNWVEAMGVDGNGNVVVTGYSYGSGSGTDYYTAKYAASNGALLWEKRYNGPANGGDGASSLALGPNGMIAITGSSDGNFGSANTANYATVVYRENLPPLAITLIPTGIRLRFTGVPGRNHIIERAAAVTGPWSTIATPVAPLDGIIEYVDIHPPSGAKFYRTTTPRNRNGANADLSLRVSIDVSAY